MNKSDYSDSFSQHCPTFTIMTYGYAYMDGLPVHRKIFNLEEQGRYLWRLLSAQFKGNKHRNNWLQHVE